MDARYINGMAKTSDKLVVLLDIDRVMGGVDVAMPSLN